MNVRKVIIRFFLRGRDKYISQLLRKEIHLRLFTRTVHSLKQDFILQFYNGLGTKQTRKCGGRSDPSY